MNKSFKSIWNESLGAWVAASEITCGRGKRSKSAAALVVASAVLIAGRVVQDAHGQGVSLGGARAVANADGVAVGTQAAAGTQGVSVGFKALANGTGNGNTGATAIGSAADAQSDRSIAIGAKALAHGDGSIALGAGTGTNGENNIAFGTASTKSIGENSIAIGHGAVAQATARGAVAVGIGATVANRFSTAIGTDARALATGSTALGSTAVKDGSVGAAANADDSIAIGGLSIVDSAAMSGIAIGKGANVAAAFAIAQGLDAKASGNSAVAVGVNSTASGAQSSAFGGGATATNEFSTALGLQAAASGPSSTAVGARSQAVALSSTAVGTGAGANADGTSAVGASASATAQSASAFGNFANATGIDSVSVGRSEAAGTAAIAVGPRAKAANFAIALGQAAQATSNSSIAIGAQANAFAVGATAMGTNALGGAAANANDSIAIGGQSVATAAATSSVAIGLAAKVAGPNSVALGNTANATDSFSLALGVQSKAFGVGTTAIGSTAEATKGSATAVGDNAIASGEKNVAVGVKSRTAGNQAAAFGASANAATDFSTALGASTLASGAGATALGGNAVKGASAGAADSIAIGGQSSVASAATSGIAIGRGATVSGGLSIAQGDGAIAREENAVALGASSNAQGAGSVAVGQGAKALGQTGKDFSAVSIGASAVVNGAASLAIGEQSNATGSRSISIGNSSGVTATNAVALGADAKVSKDGSVALGQGSVADQANVVSVGTAAAQRQIVNVAAGTALNDAVNKGQLDDAFRAIKVAGASAFAAAVAASSGDVAIGPSANATSGTAVDHAGVAIGWGATMRGNRGVAVGMRASATADDTAAYGYNANASANNSIALGSGATASQTGSVALGQGSVADRANAVSVGTAAAQRQIVNVAAGTALTDAVNVGQLNAVDVVAKKGWNLSANGEATPQNIAPGGAVDFIKGSNTTVSRTGNKITVDVSKTPTFDSVAVGTGVAGTPGTGSVTLGANGLTTIGTDGKAGAALGSNGLTTIGTDGKAGASVTSAGIDAGGKRLTNVGPGTADSDAATVKQVKAAGDNALQYDPKVGPDGKLALDKDGKPVPAKDSLTLGGVGADGKPATAPVKLANVADGSVAAGSKDAVNGGQLSAVNEIANKGWNLSANGEGATTAQKIAPGGTVDFINGSNTTVTRTGNKITVDVSKTPTFDSVTVGTGVAGTPGSGSATLGANGLTTSATGADGKMVAGPSVTTAGIDAGGKALANVGPGTNGTDAANVQQVNAVGAQAGNSLQYDPKVGPDGKLVLDKDGKPVPAKDSLTLGGVGADGKPATGPVKLANVADGSLAAGSKDAINGGQLFAVNEIANKGWNLSANGVDPVKIAPGDKVDFVNGSNTTVTRTDNKIKVDVSKTPTFDSVTVGSGVAGTPGTGSATLGANGLTTIGTDGNAGPSVSATGIDAGKQRITNVGTGTADDDVATMGQVKLAQAQAGNSMQYDGVDKRAATLGGPASTDGGKTGGTKLSNVAQGAVSATSTDAVNGAQLNATNTNANAFLGGGADVASGKAPKYDVAGGSFDNVGGALSAVDIVANKGWNLSANSEATPQNIAPGGTVNFVNGSNTTVSRDGNKITVDVSKTPTFESVTATNGTPDKPGASATLGANGLTTSTTGADGKMVAGPSVTSAGIDAGRKALTNVGAGTKDTDAANVGQVNAVGAQAGNSLQYDPKVGPDGKLALDKDGKPVPAKDSLTLGGVGADGKTPATAPVKLGNVADGTVEAGSKDAVNGGQLFAVNEIANKGWNLSANGVDPLKIAPGDAVNFVNGSNTTVSRTGNKIKVDVSKTPTFDSVTVGSGVAGTPGTGSATLGANGLTTIGPDGKAGAALGSSGLTTVGADGKPGASVTSAGIDAGGKALTNVGAGTKDTDAANVGQMNAVGAQAGNSLQYDPKVGPDGKLALDKDGKPVPAKDSLTLGGVGADGKPATAPVKLGNVADGTVEAGSKDAVNGGQLFAVNEIANKGWNLSANSEATPQNIAPGGTVDFINGSNTTVSRDGNKIKVDVSKTPTFESVTVGTGVAGTPGSGSVTLGANGLTTIGTDGKAGAALGSNGLTTSVTGADGKTVAGPSVTSAGIDAGGKRLTNVGPGTDGTDAANVQQVNAVGAKADNALQYDPKVDPDGKLALDKDGKPVPAKDSLTLGGVGADGKPATGPVKLANVADGSLAATSKDAVNGGQLFAVNEIANKGWNLSANSVDPLKIAPGDVVDFVNGSNTTVTRTDNKIKVDVSKTPVFDSVTVGTGVAGTPGSGSVTLGANGLTTIGTDGKAGAALGSNGLTTSVTGADGKTVAGPSVTSAGIDAGGKRLTNVGPGTDGTDAANVQQVNAVGAKADNSLQYDPKVDPDGKLALDKDGKPVPGKDSLTLGGVGADGKPATGPVKLGNVADGKVEAGSKDAVTGGQLNTLGTGLGNVLGGTYANGVYTPPTYVTVGGGTATTVQGALNNLGNAVSSGAVGPVQRTGNDGQLALVAPGATGAAPGAAQQLTNVKAGTVSGTSSDAVNGSQLNAVNEAVAAVGAKADNALQYDPTKDGKPGKDSLTLGGLNADGKPATGPVKLGNVADGNLAEGSRDAVNGGQLFTTNQNVTHLGNDLKNLSTSINDGKVGPLQRTGNADELVLVGKDGTAANPGAAQRVSNVANGTGAGDAVNFGQLTDVAKTANNSLQYDGADKSVATMGGTRSTDGGKTGGTKVTNVAQGALNDMSTDAVNGAQLHAANTALSNALGGGANLNDGKAPSYTVQGKTHDNVGGALGSVNENLTTVNNALNGGGIKYFRANSTLPDAVAGGTDAVAVGPNASASATASVAVGSGAKASAVNGTAVGFNAVVQQTGGVALGSGSVASTAAGVAGHVQDGAGAQQAAAVRATTSTLGAVSVGDAANGQYRQITGVAAGSADSDAANVAQLKAAASAAKAGSAQYDTNADGSTNYGQMTLGNGQAPDGTRISNVAPGVLPTDAANVGQLNQVRSQLQRQVGDVARVAYSGTAMALAMSGTSMPTLDAGEKGVGVGFGNYKGYSALALTFKALSEDGQMSWGAGVSSTGKEWGVNAGIGWKWR